MRVSPGLPSQRVLCAALAGLTITACHRQTRVWSIEKADPGTQRTTPLGEVVGGAGHFGSDAWLGIPFAAPPVGELRWRDPRPPAPWQGTREALHFGPACPQFAAALGGDDSAPDGQLTGKEDCLYLNVWAPHLTTAQVPRGSDRLPVMFWIHGGGNSIGRASMYDGGHLAAAGKVIVVTTQYRLGPLGWFRNKALRDGSGDAAEASGDFGTLDLVRGLEWVRDNISAFGGDPGNVTIFGESAGGQNVYSLLVSPKARGLFHHAIAESGGLSQTTPEEAEHFIDDATPGEPNSSSEVIARLLVEDGMAPDRAAARTRMAAMTDEQLATWLRGLDVSRIFRAYSGKVLLGMINMPLVINEGTVLPDDWLGHLGRADGWNNVPTLVGTNRDEAKLFLFFNPKLITRRLGIFPRFVDEPAYEAVAEALSRTWKATGADAPATAMHASGQKSVYVYRFDWHGESTVAGADLSRMLGAAHGLEIPFVFGSFNLGPLTKPLFDEAHSADRQGLSDAMMSYWTQFARSGSPGSGRAGDLTPWPAWEDTPRYLVLDSALEGGIHASSEVRPVAQIISDVDADTRIAGQINKCRVFHELAGWTHGIRKLDYDHIGKHGCTEFPFDQFPWDGK
jgi:para-nitrobenzyl esterase